MNELQIKNAASMQSLLSTCCSNLLLILRWIRCNEHLKKDGKIVPFYHIRVYGYLRPEQNPEHVFNAIRKFVKTTRKNFIAEPYEKFPTSDSGYFYIGADVTKASTRQEMWAIIHSLAAFVMDELQLEGLECSFSEPLSNSAHAVRLGRPV